MRQIAKMLMVGGFGAMLWLIPASATVINVPGDQPTIQTGIGAAVDGDTVLVAPGTYTESFNFLGKSIHLLSEAGSGLTTLQPSAPLTDMVTITDGEACEISGFTFVGGDGPRLIRVAGGATPLIRNNIFRDFYSILQNAVVIGCEDADPTISGNLFYNNASTSTIGIFSGTATILGNTLDDNQRGIFSLSGNGVAKNNIVSNSVGYGISGAFAVSDYNDVWYNFPDYSGGAVTGFHSISAAPLFCDPPLGDYTIAVVSPCNGSGEGGTIIGVLGVGCTDPVPQPPSLLSLGVGAPEDSLHLTDHFPTVTWSSHDPQSYPQVYFEIEVGTDDDWTVAEKWDPGVTNSSATAVVYGGSTLIDGQTYFVRVRVNHGYQWSEWWSAEFRMNSEPTVPEPEFPAEGALVSFSCFELRVTNSTDDESDPMTYDFQIFEDVALTILAFEMLNHPSGSGSTSTGTISALDPNVTYWWRARAYDGHEYSLWSTTRSFETRATLVIHVPGDVATIQEAIDRACDYDTVLVAPGIYTETFDYKGKAVVVTSAAGAAATFIQPPGIVDRVVRITNGEPIGTELSGFTFLGADGHYVIDVAFDAHVTISDNIFRDCAVFDQVIRSYRGYVDILRNVFYNNSAAPCIWIYQFSTTITDNTFDNNHSAISAVYVGSPDVYVRNNIITRSASVGVYGDVAELDYNCIFGNNPDYDGGATAGPNSIQVDPQYCDSAGHDYTLAESSPCLGTGLDGTDMGALGVGCESPVIARPHVIDLSIGSSDDSLHLLDHTPTIAWQYFDPQALPLVETEVEIGSDNDWTSAEMWQTSLPGTDTSITYDGLPLLDGATYYLRVRVWNGAEWSLWREMVFRMNSIPAAPVPAFPTNDTVVPNLCVQLEAHNTTDAEQDTLTYDFVLFRDLLMTDVVAAFYDVPEGSVQTATETVPGLSETSQYWWHVRAFDAREYSDWSDLATFATPEVVSVRVPDDFTTIQAAIDGAQICGADLINVAPGTYYGNLDFLGKAITIMSEEGPDNTVLVPTELDAPGVYLWNSDTGTAVLSGFTIMGGTGLNAVTLQGTSCRLENSIIRGFHSPPSGAYVVYCNAGPHEVTGNLFVDNTTIGCLGIHETSQALITHNTFDRSSKGVWSGNDQSVAQNNIVSNCETVAFQGVWQELDYNCTWDNETDYLLTTGEAGPNSVYADPLYCGYAADDYSLAAASPCLGAGTSGTDIGAYGLGCAEPLPSVESIHIGTSSDSLHLTDHAPLIAWGFKDLSGHALTQSEIEVGTDDDWTAAEMWDPAPVAGDTTEIQYQGSELIDGASYYVRVRVNNGVTWSAWLSAYFRMNSLPTVPILLSPIDGASVCNVGLTLIVENSTDDEGDPKHYDFEVYADPGLTTLVDSVYGQPQTPTQTEWDSVSGIIVGGAYWWRARAHDSYEYSDWSPLEDFVITGDTVLIVPDDFPTIQDALNAACSGYSVIVRPGTYVENLDFLGKAVKLQSEKEADSTLLVPANPSVPTIRIVSVLHPGALFAGFTVTGGGTRSVLYLEASTSVEIRDNVFRDHLTTDPPGTSPAASVQCNTSSALIQRNVFYNNRTVDDLGYAAIVVFTGPVRVSHNTFDRNSVGFYARYSSVTEFVNNIVTNSVRYGVRGTFVTLDYNCVFNNNPDYSVTLPGPNSISEDPLYCAPDTGDYRIEDVSPCVGAGEEGTDMGAGDVGCGPPCACPCHGDPQCDGVSDVLDVVNAVNVAFRGVDPTTDPLCLYEQTDVSCDGVTNVIDVVKFVNVAFRGGDAGVEFCDPCDSSTMR